MGYPAGGLLVPVLAGVTAFSYELHQEVFAALDSLKGEGAGKKAGG